MDSSPATTAKTFKYNSPHQTAFNIIESPFHHKSFGQNYTIRDGSFSSYLKPKESDKFPTQIGQCVSDDTELNVFDAQKYFSETNNDHKESKEVLFCSQSNLNHVSKPSDAGWRLSSASSSVDRNNRNFRVRSFHATPTASSEASWNSQTGLLSNPPGSIPVSLRNITADHGSQKRVSSSASKWLFCRKCPCTGKKSVQVDEGSSEHRAEVGKQDNSNNNNKSNFHQKKEGHQIHKHEKILAEKMSMMSEKSSANNHDVAERHQTTLNSITSRLPSDNHFMSSSVLQQRVLASERPFSDNAMAFSFPILNPSCVIMPESKVLPTPPKINIPSDEPPRESLEIFQPSDHTILRKSMDEQRVALGAKTLGNLLDRRGNFTFSGSPVIRVTSNEDDVASDASSDLFEIESLSTQTTSYPMYRRRDSLDEASTFSARRLAAASNGVGAFYGDRRCLDEPMTPMTENYAPSEASIDWSVTTAEGFDRASITNFSVTASEIEDFAIMSRRSMEKGTTDHSWNSIGTIQGGGESGGEGGKKKGNGFLLSCRHERAVSVGPHPVKYMPEGGPPWPLVSTSGHVNTAASRQPKPNTPPLAKGHSARLSLTFTA
ncbi:hypothetical protein ACH5RR_006853 [Cinchona calisaya]|uniref:Phytochrome kinase substrate 1 n=1 Tax=Cinchona calisaya TaxID=153742 RepID=A0ABD3AQ44_9GENT